jgi:hypothetical protein
LATGLGDGAGAAAGAGDAGGLAGSLDCAPAGSGKSHAAASQIVKTAPLSD